MPLPNLATLLVELESLRDFYEEKIKRFYYLSGWFKTRFSG